MKKNYDWTGFWLGRPLLLEKIYSWYEARICLRAFKKLDVKTCLELGGGPGYMAKLIAQNLGYELTLIDDNKEAYRLFRKISNFGNYVFGDFFKYKPRKKVDLVFSFGVIEHYSDRKRRLEVIKLHKRLSNKYVAIFVPKDCLLVRSFFHFPEKGFEKLYKQNELKNELEETGLKILNFFQNIRAIGYLCEIN